MESVNRRYWEEKEKGCVLFCLKGKRENENRRSDVVLSVLFGI